MYQVLLVSHSVTRWLVLTSLFYAAIRAYHGYAQGRKFTKADDTARHVTATIAHIQFMIGSVLYFQSPMISYFWEHFRDTVDVMDYAFFGIVHITLMFVAIILVSVGSSLAKRHTTDRLKFKTILIWYSLALLIILVIIPWPFSPLSARPAIRLF